MIGRLTGKLLAEEPLKIVLDVHGVGYEVAVPVGAVGRARDGAPAAGEAISLFIHTHVREDALDLFGFASEAERNVFRLLITLPNVGPKTALGILSALPPAELSSAVHAGDLVRLGKVPGIGKKTAERLVLELKEKLPRLEAAGPKKGTPLAPGASNAERLLAALTNMGYRPSEGERALKALGDKLDTLPLSESLREALRHLTP
jgi:Holliday junction DNA helicase RuvA